MKLELFDADSLNIVEFNITGDNDNYIRCDAESKYLETEVFNLFIDCFERSNRLYDYFEPTKYNARTIIPLLNELKYKNQELESIPSYQEFEAYISRMFLGKDVLNILIQNEKDLENNWPVQVEKIKKICNEIIRLINNCIEDDSILWVIGY